MESNFEIVIRDSLGNLVRRSKEGFPDASSAKIQLNVEIFEMQAFSFPRRVNIKHEGNSH